MPTRDPFGARASLGPGLPDAYLLARLAGAPDLGQLPVTVKILLENVLRHAGNGPPLKRDFNGNALRYRACWCPTQSWLR